ncbi:MAG: hypothetical protein ACXWAX_10055 [Chthoniobacterales bacterium]
MPVLGFAGLDAFRFVLAALLFRVLHRGFRESLRVLHRSARDLGIHDRIAALPWFAFTIKHARQSLLRTGAVVDHPTFRRRDVESCLRSVNDPERDLLSACASEQSEDEDKSED